MKIEILEKIMHERDLFEQGDIRTVPDEIGEYFCSCGWAKDIDGSTPTGNRSTTEVRVVPGNVTHGHRAGEV